MRLDRDHHRRLVEAGSAEQKRLCRKPDGMLSRGISMEREIRQSAWAEAQHIKAVRRLEREAAERQRERERSSYWFRVKSSVLWGDNGKGTRRTSAPHRAIRSASTRGALPSYGFAIRDKAGKLFVFQRIRYSSAANSKQGRARELVNYGIDGAHVFEDGSPAFSSNVGKSREEAGEAFDQIELINRTSARNAKTVFHAIMQSCHDLAPEEQFEMARSYCEYAFGSQDLPYSLALHPPSEDGDRRNWHVHVVFSFRPMVHTGEGEWEVGRFLRTDLDNPEQFKRLRFLWAEEMNQACARAGIAKRYTHLSYQAAGVDFIPQEHLGPALTAKARRGETVRKNMRNMQAVARNSARHAVRETRMALRTSVAAVLEHTREQLEVARLAASVASPGRVRRTGSIVDPISQLPERLDQNLRKEVGARTVTASTVSSDKVPARASAGAWGTRSRLPSGLSLPVGDLPAATPTPLKRYKKGLMPARLADYALPSFLPAPLTRKARGKTSVPAPPVIGKCPLPLKARSSMTSTDLRLPATAPAPPNPLNGFRRRTGLQLPKIPLGEPPRRLPAPAMQSFAEKAAAWLAGLAQACPEPKPFSNGQRSASKVNLPVAELPVSLKDAVLGGPTAAEDRKAVRLSRPEELPTALARRPHEFARRAANPAKLPSGPRAAMDRSRDDVANFSALKSRGFEDARRLAPQQEPSPEISVGEVTAPKRTQLHSLALTLARTPSALRMDDAGIVRPGAVRIASFGLTNADVASREAQRRLLPLFAEQQLAMDRLEEEVFRRLSSSSPRKNKGSWVRRDDVAKMELSREADAIRAAYHRSRLFDELVLRLNERNRGKRMITRRAEMLRTGFDPDSLAARHRQWRRSQEAGHHVEVAGTTQHGR